MKRDLRVWPAAMALAEETGENEKVRSPAAQGS
jgi:hypothetical protein